MSVYLDFRDAIKRDGMKVIQEKYGNLFQMYEKITDENPYEVPMRMYPAVHYTMGGLWVDYFLMSNIQGLHVLGEANFSDHGANRLGASALMQGLADGYFVIPYTIGHYIASQPIPKVTTDHPEFVAAEQSVRGGIDHLLKIGAKGNKTALEYYRELGKIMWDHVGMARNDAGLKSAIQSISNLRGEYWENLKLTGDSATINKELELAARVGDFLEQGQLMAQDSLERKESCGGHFREESQTPEGEAQRDDDNFSHVSAWEYQGPGKSTLHKEPLVFENVHPSQRSYK